MKAFYSCCSQRFVLILLEEQTGWSFLAKEHFLDLSSLVFLWSLVWKKPSRDKLPRVEDPNSLFVPLLHSMPFPQSGVHTTLSKSKLSNLLFPTLINRPLSKLVVSLVALDFSHWWLPPVVFFASSFLSEKEVAFPLIATFVSGHM
jgi:hypothetical protein